MLCFLYKFRSNIEVIIAPIMAGVPQSTGYGPSATGGRWNRLCFDGDEQKYEQWEMKFLGYMKLRKLKDTILLADNTGEPDDFYSKNEEAFAELIQFLDDRSLSLIMRDAVDDGREALKILREHYAGTGKPRIITLYTELTSLVKKADETVTDYIIKAETAAMALRNAEEEVSDSLLIAMALKGLPEEYKPFVVVVTQREDDLTFQEFKVMLRNYESTENTRNTGDDSVMKASFNGNCFDCGKFGHVSRDCGSKKCFSCGKSGHVSRDCGSKTRQEHAGQGDKWGDKPRMWCSFCRMSNHTDKTCGRKRGTNNKDSTRYVSNDDQDDSGNGHTFAFMLSNEKPKNKPVAVIELLVDCGATTHIITDQSYFVKYDDTFKKSNHFIELADGTRSNNIALKRGNAVVILTDVGGRQVEATLQNALYIPSYPNNIFSVKSATEHGATIKFGPKTSEMIAADGTKFNIEQHGKLYYFSNSSSVSHVNKVRDLEMWHKILGHCNTSDVVKLEGVAEGMKISSTDKFNCEICMMGKQTVSRSREPRARATKILDLVHTDLVCVPVEQTTREGFRWGITFTDDYSGLMFVYFLKHKNYAVKALEQFLADTAPYGKVKCVRSDNGTEFTCKEFQDVLRKNLIKHETSAPYSPHQNGTAERGMRTLFEMARCLLLESGLPKTLWTYAVMISAYIRNRCYSQRTEQTPFYMFTGKKPNLKNMHIFGGKCYAYENLPKKKLDARSKAGVFVGYDKGSPAYLVYHPDTMSVKRYRCVQFIDTKGDSVVNKPMSVYDDMYDVDVNETDNVPGNNNIPDAPGNVENIPDDADDVPDNIDNVPGDAQEVGDGRLKDRPVRERKMPKHFDDYVTGVKKLDDKLGYTVDFCYRLVVGVPKTFQEAMSGPDAIEWKNSMEDEMTSLKDNDTFTITELPEDRQSVGGRWVYALKDCPEGGVRYKARYVAKGYSQKEGIDYYETFSPTARMTSLRIMIQLATEFDLYVHQLDVKTAYLNAPIDCEIYVEQPEGFKVDGSNKKLVWRLNKSLYGLKQSGRNWHNVLHEHLTQNDFIQSLVDTCIYTKHVKDSTIIMLVWVDDIIIAASSESSLVEVKNLLKNRFKMTDLGQLNCFLGIQFKFENGVIKMNQTRYLKKVLCRYNMNDCKPKATPSELKLIFSDDREVVDETKYREMVGSLVYAMTCTRPDLGWIITKLSQYLSRPTAEHHTAVKHVLRYVKGTLNHELCFRKSDGNIGLIGFADADWGSSEDRKSITGYCFKMGNYAGPILSWKSKRQQTIALSSCEAEYMALTCATQEAIFLSQLIRDMVKNYQPGKIILYGDNQGALALAKNPISHKRSKHIDIKYHFIRSHVQNGTIELTYVPTEDNIADIFTKSVSKFKFERFAQMLFG